MSQRSDSEDNAQSDSTKAEVLNEFEGPMSLASAVDPEAVAQGSELLTSLESGQFLALTPGNSFEVVNGPRHHAHKAILINAREVLFIDGVHRSRLAIAANGPPMHGAVSAEKVVAVYIHQSPAGPGPSRFVYALDASNTMVARIDDTGTWEFRVDELQQICQVVGLSFERVSFDRVTDLLRSRPELAEPRLEFEEDHPIEEEAREWAMGIAYGGTIAVVLLGSTGTTLVFFSPVGPWYRALIVAAFVVLEVLTWFSLSKWRMRRSMRMNRTRRKAQVC